MSEEFAKFRAKIIEDNQGMASSKNQTKIVGSMIKFLGRYLGLVTTDVIEFLGDNKSFDLESLIQYLNKKTKVEKGG